MRRSFLRKRLSVASAWRRSTDTSASSLIGSPPVRSHSCGSTDRHKSCVSGCKHPGRLGAGLPKGFRTSGKTGRTIKRRIARTRLTYRRTLADIGFVLHRFDELSRSSAICPTNQGRGTPRLDVTTPCRLSSRADRLALVTATNSGSPVPERDDAAQPSSAESSSPQASTAPPPTTGPAKPSVTVDKPALGAPIDRIPVHKVSPVIEGGAYP